MTYEADWMRAKRPDLPAADNITIISVDFSREADSSYSNMAFQKNTFKLEECGYDNSTWWLSPTNVMAKM